MAYLLCALAMGLIVLCMAEAGSRVAMTGGPYAYIEVAFGPFVGFLAGFLLWMLLTFAMAAVATVLVSSLGALVPVLSSPAASVAALIAVYAAFSAINIQGVERGSRLNTGLTIAKILPLVLLIAGGLFAIDPDNLAIGNPPDMPLLARSSLLLIFAFAGNKAAVVPGGEVKDPSRTVPRAIFISGEVDHLQRPRGGSRGRGRARCPYTLARHGVWRSLVAHSLWERGAVGSNPATPTDGSVRMRSVTCRARLDFIDASIVKAADAVKADKSPRSTPVKSTVETLGPTRVRFAIEVPFAELEPSLKKAYREIGAPGDHPRLPQGKGAGRRHRPAHRSRDDPDRGGPGGDPAADAGRRPGARGAHPRPPRGRDHRVRRRGRRCASPPRWTSGPRSRCPTSARSRSRSTRSRWPTRTSRASSTGCASASPRSRRSTGPPLAGDFVQIDLAATVDGAEVPGGTATNLSHEVGSNQLLPGLDEAIEGMSAGASTTFTTKLVGGDYAGQEAEVAVTVKTVKERELPDVDDEFAQLASEFDTLDELRADLCERLSRVKKVEQLYAARDKALEALVAASDVPAPDGRGRATRSTAARRPWPTSSSAWAARWRSTSPPRARPRRSSTPSSPRPPRRASRSSCCSTRSPTPRSCRSPTTSSATRWSTGPSGPGMSPQQYYDQLVKAGMAATVYGDVRRGKALAAILEQVTIKDSDGEPITLDDLKDDDEDHTGHDHD